MKDDYRNHPGKFSGKPLLVQAISQGAYGRCGLRRPLLGTRFFGRIRRATRNFTGVFSPPKRIAILLSVIRLVVADRPVSRAYIELQGHPTSKLEMSANIPHRKVRGVSLKLVKARFDYGWIPTPVLMTENLVYGARAVVPDLKRAIKRKKTRSAS